MGTIIEVIWPNLLAALLTVIGLYVGYIHKLKVDVAVLQKTVEDQQKIIDNMIKRLDSHSKKQDEIYETLTTMKVEIVKQMGAMTANISSLASDLKGLNNLLTMSQYNNNKHNGRKD